MSAISDGIEKEDGTSEGAVSDKRLLVVESEFASPLKRMIQPGNTLSETLRLGFDSLNLGTLTKQTPQRVTEPHISVVGHITPDELLTLITDVSMANGFINRFLLFMSKRSHSFPEGFNEALGPFDPTGPTRELAEALQRAQSIGLMRRSAAARQAWAPLYEKLNEDKPGLIGAALARGPAQVLRLQTLFAALDGSDTIEPCHLEAAFAVWEYTERSVMHVFRGRLGNRVAQRLIERMTPRVAVSKTDRFAMRNNNVTATDLHSAIKNLHHHNLTTTDYGTESWVRV